MSGNTHLRTALVAGLLSVVAAGSSNCEAKSYTTCSGLCQGSPACNQNYDECLESCVALDQKCERVGHPEAFLAYLTCVNDAGFACGDAGQPVASALCQREQADLVQCESEGDASLTIPDGAFDADTECADVANCSACCKEHHESGALMYATLVSECTCKPAVCKTLCATEACAGDAQTEPQANDMCDQCLSNALNDLTPDAGACVVPITLQCNQIAECALFVNCGTQTGCTH